MKNAFALVMTLMISGGAVAGQSQQRIVDEGKLGAAGISLASIESGVRYPAEYATADDDVCIALGYTVNLDGSTGDYQVLRAWSSNQARARSEPSYLNAFATAAIEAVSQGHFAEINTGVPIGTVATITFNGSGEARRLGDRCRISQLANYYKAVGRNGLANMKGSQGLANAVSYSMSRQLASARAYEMNQPVMHGSRGN